MSLQNQKQSTIQKRIIQLATITTSLIIGASVPLQIANAQIRPVPTRPVNPEEIRPVTPEPAQEITDVTLDTENEAVQNLLLEAVRTGNINEALENWSERAELSEEEIRALRQLDEVDLKILGENIEQAENNLARIRIRIVIRTRKVTIEICIGC